MDLEAAGRSVPALDAQPQLTILQAQAVEAFWAMNPARPVAVGMDGGVPLGLPVTEILATAMIYGFDPAWFLQVARAADRAYLDHGHRTPRGRTGSKPISQRRK